ncbi:MAG TPA: ATP-dependent DNA ligase [Gemmatimonadaceae bacterium]|nr:ATP-dependent DNA ligase [Gemmatimonadaceae bacterium]
MTLPIKSPFLPMEAVSVATIPEGDSWQYEPKWDGFRCIVFRDGDDVELQSKAGQPLARYFPDLVASILAVGAKRFVLDGEIVVPVNGDLSFDDLLQRIHPAASRITKLASETPASFIAFDLLVTERGTSLVEQPLAERRPKLDSFAASYFASSPRVSLSPATTELRVVKQWFDNVGGGLDGIIAKKLGEPYRTGERKGMVKVKQMRTVECVVGGFRYASAGKIIGSMLLGLYDDDGLLHHVGFCSGLTTAHKEELTPKLEKLVEKPGFTGQAPGGPSRWSTERTAEWQPLASTLVVEIQYDHFTGGRFRHGTRFIRWRPDKAPRQCTMDQLGGEQTSPLALLERSGGAS